MRAIVTGGAGFIGSHLVDALVARGDEVLVLDNFSTGRRERLNDGATLAEVDIREADAVRAAFAGHPPEVVFHLAAQADVRVSVEDPAFDAIFFGRLAEGQPPRIFGDGSQTRDYVYVGDVVDATLAAAGTDGGVFNVGTGRETSVTELADACMRVSGIELEPVFEPARLGELQRSFLDPSRTAEVLGTRAETSLDDGLAATWRSVEGAGGAGAN